MTSSIFSSEDRQHSPSVFQLGGATRAARVVDFCYLSNKFFPTEGFLAELAEDFGESVRNYPSMQGQQCQLASVITGFPADQILVGNGASELIHLMAAQVGSRWLMAYPSYMEYENVIRDFGKELFSFQVFEEEDFRVDVDRVLEEIRAHAIDAVVLPNPNSPTGQKLDLPELLKLLEGTRDLAAVVIDESFIEFTAVEREGIPTLRSKLDEYPQLIIIRSLGKDFGVCGLRLGLLATANRSCLDSIRRYLPIWNISPLAEKFLRLCSGRMEEYEAARVECIRETRLLAARLGELEGVKVYPTYSNFILFQILESGVTSVALRDYLLGELGYYVRDCSRKLGLTDRFIRVGTNLPAENEGLVRGIGGFLAAKRGI